MNTQLTKHQCCEHRFEIECDCCRYECPKYALTDLVSALVATAPAGIGVTTGHPNAVWVLLPNEYEIALGHSLDNDGSVDWSVFEGGVWIGKAGKLEGETADELATSFWGQLAEVIAKGGN